MFTPTFIIKSERTVLSMLSGLLFVWLAVPLSAGVAAAPLIDPTERAALESMLERLGPDRPVLGRSAFDALFVTAKNGEWEYDIPFPFSRILDRLDLAVGVQDDTKESPLKIALIPFSRCLNRDLTSPRQFAFPRMVVVVDTEAEGIPETRPVFIKNRVFLGYQPNANTIEIISYNETAGRFEFQVVSDYRDGGQPKVEYAKRTLCMSCHQTGGPIFSRAPWNETSSNNDIIKELVANGAGGLDRLNFPIGSIDRATDNARMFNAYQTLWGPLCNAKTRGDSVRCRAGLLELMLEKRFFRIRGAFTDSDLVSKHFLPIAGIGIIEQWPNGVPIPSADIPNRRPLHLDTPTSVERRTDPLRPRPVRLALPFEEIGRLIEGLAAFLPFVDMKTLNDQLYESNPDPSDVRWRFRGTCEIVNQDQGDDRELIGVECQVSDRSLRRRFNLLGDLFLDHESVIAREPLNRWLVGDGMFFNNVYHEGSPVSIEGDYWKIVLEFNAGDSRFHVWLPDGAAIESVVIRWPREPGAQSPLAPDARVTGDGVMTLRPGYARIAIALERMVERAIAGELGVFDDGAFRGGAVIQALLEELGVSSTGWCCDDWSKMPAALTSEHLAAPSANRTRAAFNQYCADCHALPHVSPSSFLSGTQEEVESKLGKCAEQIYYRLGMWDIEGKLREKTPMPPALHLIQLERLIPEERMRSDLQQLRAYAASLLQRDAAQVMASDYANIKTCGPF